MNGLGTRMLWILGVVLVFFSAQNACAEGEIYRCVYHDGRVEFRGMPVLDANCVPVKHVQRDSDASVAAPASPTEERQVLVPESAEPVDIRARNCEIARENLEMLETGEPVVVTGPDGNPALLTEGDRVVRLRQTERDVDYWCVEP